MKLIIDVFISILFAQIILTFGRTKKRRVQSRSQFMSLSANLNFYKTEAEKLYQQLKTKENREACPNITPKELPNAKNWLGVGYDIFKGNPMFSPKDGTVLDTGFRSDLFEIENTDERTSDLLFYIPKGYYIKRQEACSTQLSTKKITTIQELSEESTNKVTGGADIDKSDAVTIYTTASLELKSTASKIDTNEIIITTTSGACNIYKADFNTYESPKLSQVFINGLLTLKDLTFDEKDKNADAYKQYMNLLDNFGTHYLSTIYIGSKFSLVIEFNRKKIETITEKGWEAGIDVSASLSKGINTDKKAQGTKTTTTTKTERSNAKTIFNGNDGMISVTAGGSIKGGLSDKSAKTLEEAVGKYYITSIGAPLPPKDSSKTGGLDTAQWLKFSKETPMPISYEIERITKLLNYPSYKGQLKSLGFDDTHVADLIVNIKAAIKAYCPYLRDVKKLVDTCEKISKSVEREYWTPWGKISDTFGWIVPYVNCQDGEALSFFTQQWSQDTSVRFYYKCLKSGLVNSGLCKKDNTMQQKIEIDKDLSSYSNHFLSCDSNMVMNSWQFQTDGAKDSPMGYFKYECCEAQIQDCIDHKEPIIGSLYYKSELMKTALAQDYVIQSWKINENSVLEIKACKLKSTETSSKTQQ
jgi:hypothetical protein